MLYKEAVCISQPKQDRRLHAVVRKKLNGLITKVYTAESFSVFT